MDFERSLAILLYWDLGLELGLEVSLLGLKKLKTFWLVVDWLYSIYLLWL